MGEAPTGTAPPVRTAMAKGPAGTVPAVRTATSVAGRSGSSGRALGEGEELAAELLYLVPELRGVLEPELLGRREHLLLEVDDAPLDLGAAHAPPLTPAAATPSGLVRLLGREEHA